MNIEIPDKDAQILLDICGGLEASLKGKVYPWQMKLLKVISDFGENLRSNIHEERNGNDIKPFITIKGIMEMKRK